MQKNEAPIERILRVIVGVAILSLVFVLEGKLRYIGLFGLLPLITGLTGFCPIYSLLGIYTLRKN